MTCAKPVPFRKFYHPVTSSKRKFSRTASSTFRCAATPRKSTRCLYASIRIIALQSTFKILINSFYGYLGFQMGDFNDFDAANQVTAKGRDLIQSVIAWLKKNAAKIVEVDTDGIYFMPPESVKTAADEEQFGANLAAILPN